MRSIELFAGAGGLGIGVCRAGFKPALVVEWDRWACDTIRENQARGLEPFTQWPLTEGDVRSFDFLSLQDSIDLVAGGPPCQPFSLGGMHRAFLDARDMFPQAIRAVREIRPRAFLFENVKGLKRTAFADYLEYIRLQLRHPELGNREDEPWLEHLQRLEDHETFGRHDGLHYNVVIRTLNAADYGVPQKRERVFIVGFRADTRVEWHFPASTHSQDALQWEQWRTGLYWDLHRVARKDRPPIPLTVARIRPLIAPTLEPWRTVRDAIADLPDPEHFGAAAAEVPNHCWQPGARAYAGHTGSPLDEPAKTLKAGVHGVPGGENMLRRLDGTVRYFSIRESARLQTFPDEMAFHGSWSETMRQLGNAVPCRLAAVVASKINHCLAGTA